MGRRFVKDVLDNHLQEPMIPFRSLVEYHPIIKKKPIKNSSIWKESFTWIVPRIRSVRGENLEGWRADRRLWGVGDDGRVGNLIEKSQCERVDISQRKRKIYFHIADERIKILGGDQDLRTSILVRPRPTQRRCNIDVLGKSARSLPPLHDSFPEVSEAMNDFRSMSGNFIYRHHVEPRVKLNSPKKESFIIPLLACGLFCEQFSLSTFPDNFYDAFFWHRLKRINGIRTCVPKF